MSTFKPFFIHFNRTVTKKDSSKRRHQPRGFTAYIQPSALERHVQVQVAYCSASDEFVKATGRKLAQAAETQAINARDVPNTLAEFTGKCVAQPWFYDEASYLYVLKYMV